jgi:hypothetical protein
MKRTKIERHKIIPKREWLESLMVEADRLQIPLFMKNSLKKIWGEPLIQQYPESLRPNKAAL